MIVTTFRGVDVPLRQERPPWLGSCVRVVGKRGPRLARCHCCCNDVYAKAAAAPHIYFDYNITTWWLLFPSVIVIKIGHFVYSTRYIFKSRRTILPVGVIDSQ